MEMVLNNGFTDINDENLHNINAGLFLEVCAVIGVCGAAAGAVCGLIELGKNIGYGIYYITH